MRTAKAVVALAAILGACRTGGPVDPGYAPRPVRELERWDVTTAARELGQLVLVAIDDPRAEVRFYRVEDGAGQWVGFVDLQGRVYQRVPFSMTEVFRGVYTMDQALGVLYDARGPYVFDLRSKEGRPVEAAVSRHDGAALLREAAR